MGFRSYGFESGFRRVSVLRGRVVTSNGAELRGVRISETKHLGYGFTLSRGGGLFDLLVNGGSSVELSFMRTPFGKMERKFSIPWNQIVYVGDVVMSRDEVGLMVILFCTIVFGTINRITLFFIQVFVHCACFAVAFARIFMVISVVMWAIIL